MPMTDHTEPSIQSGFFGKRLSDYFGVEANTLLQIRRQGNLCLAVTRLISSRSDRMVSSQIPSEPAFSILHQLADVDDHSCWPDGRPRFSGSFRAGMVSVTDLRENVKFELKG